MNDRAMAEAVQAAAKPKFRGHNALKSKVVTHYPDNLEREYERITNTYMTLLNKELTAHLPTVREAIDSERQGLSVGALSVVATTFLQIQASFEKKAVDFGLDRKLSKLSDLTLKRSVREWGRVVNKTLGINIMEDYYKGEFYRNALKLWIESNVSLIKTVPQDTLRKMQHTIQEGFIKGATNTAIGKRIEEIYGMERKHARFIARDQMAKLNADITQSQQRDAGVDKYVWRSSGDQRVRERHRELDGTQQNWSEPPIVDKRTGRRCHPGQDYNCRCVALPVFSLSELSLPWAGNGITITDFSVTMTGPD